VGTDHVVAALYLGYFTLDNGIGYCLMRPFYDPAEGPLGLGIIF
jgi:hypothetical protein